MKELKGICVASITPFKENSNEFDEIAFREHMDDLIDAGVHIILVNSGTGEFAYLRAEEKKRIAEIAAKHINGRTDFMVQTSAINTEETIEFSKHAEANGADGLLVLPPYFEGPGDEGVLYHFEALSNSINTPVMVYNIPQYTNYAITPEFFKKLMEFDNIKYIKDSSEDFKNVLYYLNEVDDKDAVFNGFDACSLEGLIAGCGGSVLGVGNIMPKNYVQLYDFVKTKKYDEAIELWEKMRPLNLFLCAQPFSQIIKAAVNMTGKKVGDCRRPLDSLPEKTLTALKEIIERSEFE